eukprot:6445791-Lingulodinium_polyedra.AAC.1
MPVCACGAAGPFRIAPVKLRVSLRCAVSPRAVLPPVPLPRRRPCFPLRFVVAPTPAVVLR